MTNPGSLRVASRELRMLRLWKRGSPVPTRRDRTSKTRGIARTVGAGSVFREQKHMYCRRKYTYWRMGNLLMIKENTHNRRQKYTYGEIYFLANIVPRKPLAKDAGFPMMVIS